MTPLIAFEWLATISGVVSVFCVAVTNPKARLTGFALFCFCNTVWIISGVYSENTRLIIMNLIFMLANFIGIYSSLRELKNLQDQARSTPSDELTL